MKARLNRFGLSGLGVALSAVLLSASAAWAIVQFITSARCGRQQHDDCIDVRLSHLCLYGFGAADNCRQDEYRESLARLGADRKRHFDVADR